MSGTTCAICLEDAKSPVSIPCGHIHCEKCLIQCVEACDDAVECPCPTCRALFMIATPDLRFVPAKYHPFIQSSVRRVYPSPSDVVQALEERNETLRSDNSALKDKIKNFKARNDHLQRDKQRLMDTCEATQAAVANYREMERQLRDEIDLLNDEKADREQEAADWERKYRELKDKYHELKKSGNSSKPSSSGPTAAKPAKRSSTQAALDVSPEQGPTMLNSRLILPIPKRPRLTSSTSRKSTRNDMVVDDHEELNFTERFKSGITSHSGAPLPQPKLLAPARGASRAAPPPPPTTVASTSMTAAKKKALQTGLTIYLNSLDVDEVISDEEEKDGPSKTRHHPPTGASSSTTSASRSQAPSPPQPAGPSRRPTQAKPRAPPSPWDVFGSEEGSRGNLDFSLGSSSPGFPEEFVSTDEEDAHGRERRDRRERAYVFRGRRVQRSDA